MKNNRNYLLLLVLCVLSITFYSCNKDDEKNESKTVSISELTIGNGNVVMNDTETYISASISNNAQEISSVKFLIDGKEDKTLLSAPFSYTKKITDISTGTHTFDVIVRTSNGAEVSKSSVFDFKVSEGDRYQGGVVIKVSSDGFSGTIASTYDIDGQYKYGAYNGEAGYSMDDGLDNTNKFAVGYDFGYAANVCLKLERDGYDDWYLPAYNEMALFEKFLEKLNYPERAGLKYWTSTAAEDDAKKAYGYGIGTMLGNPCDKQMQMRVRPCRRFCPEN